MILAIDFAERGAKPVYAESASNSSCLLGLFFLELPGKWTMAQQFVAILMMYGNFDIILDPFPTLFATLFHKHRTPYTHAACCDLLGGRAYRALIGACNPMVECPISGNLGPQDGVLVRRQGIPAQNDVYYSSPLPRSRRSPPPPSAYQ